MRNLRLDIEYDGTNYHGWQVQENAVTVSGTIEAALERILQEPVRLMGSGRTDAGVHALGQVANFRTEKTIPEVGLQRALNSLLPGDIVIQCVRQVGENFHARRDAIERWYRYQCQTGSHPSALYRNLTCHLRRPLAIEPMREAARYLLGTHDFSAFRSIHCDAENPVRTVTSFEVIARPPLIHFDVRANAFLRNQMRIMVSTILEAGIGKIKPEDVRAILESRDRRRAGPTLPAKGLILMQVVYPGD